jgi:glyoxylase-like metal-dependent hydrolase (beta-lactamase superfamily II)
MTTKNSLTLVTGNSYFTSGIFSAGVFKTNNFAVLIDSGSDEQSAKNIYESIKDHNVPIHAIINTHCHPDHCGGNAFFQKLNPAITIYAHADEKLFIEDPKWAPRLFCCGAAPFAGLKNKHIGPQKKSVVTHTLSNEDHIITICDKDFKIIALPGHTPGSIGIITPDNVLYSGDALFGKETFNKHPVLFYTDIEDTLYSLKKLASLKIHGCVLYHGGLLQDLAEIVTLHETRILEIKEAIFTAIKKQANSIDSITQQIMQQYQIPDSLISFTLTQTTIRAYLTKLEQEELITLKVFKGLLQAYVS